MENCGFEVELVSLEKGVFICSKDRREKPGAPLDCVFPVIHGSFGEDGKLQSLLKELGLAFVGSDTSGCERSFDKIKTKELVTRAQVPQAPYLSFVDCEPDFDELVSQLGLPFFVKPARTGSSIGISKVMDREGFPKLF